MHKNLNESFKKVLKIIVFIKWFPFVDHSLVLHAHPKMTDYDIYKQTRFPSIHNHKGIKSRERERVRRY